MNRVRDHAAGGERYVCPTGGSIERPRPLKRLDALGCQPGGDRRSGSASGALPVSLTPTSA